MFDFNQFLSMYNVEIIFFFKFLILVFNQLDESGYPKERDRYPKEKISRNVDNQMVKYPRVELDKLVKPIFSEISMDIRKKIDYFRSDLLDLLNKRLSEIYNPTERYLNGIRNYAEIKYPVKVEQREYGPETYGDKAKMESYPNKRSYIDN